MALSGTAMEGIIGEIARYKNGGSFIDGFVLGAIDGFINGFMAGAIMYCASQAVTALAKVASSRCVTPSNCFIAWIIVLTRDGNKKIEDIEEGDEVWAYDEDTGKKALKKVVHLFQNKTRKWFHLFFKLENDEKEEIVCTEEHPFYVKDIGWVNAINLVANDKILLYNNDIAILYNIEIEELEREETTYNFEVEDYHTYYVGDTKLLAHNDCRSKAIRKAWKLEKANVKNGGDGVSRKWTDAEKIELLKRGKVKGYFGHHMKSVKGYPHLASDPSNIQFLTFSEHLAAHGGNFQNITHGIYLIGG